MGQSKAEHHGLRLSLPGAPASWHHVPDLGYWFHPEHVTPVGQPGEPTLEQARAWAKDDRYHVELVDDHHHRKSRQIYDDFIQDTRGQARRILASAEGDEELIAQAQSAPATVSIPGEKE
ncbi:MAG TPA: hypothetical protein VNT51_05870 [Miltoncostaeaceae bacterium]|nr:hypothetical protein [Miltoncostaeaceae bacterium]